MLIEVVSNVFVLMFLVALAGGFIVCAVNGLYHFIEDFKAALRKRIHDAVREVLYEEDLSRAVNNRSNAGSRPEGV